MPQLIVRNLEEKVVRALRERAASKGRSTEAEHREILREALSTTRRRVSLKSLLSDMPDAGNDADFARPRAKARKVRRRGIETELRNERYWTGAGMVPASFLISRACASASSTKALSNCEKDTAR